MLLLQLVRCSFYSVDVELRAAVYGFVKVLNDSRWSQRRRRCEMVVKAGEP